MYERRMFIGSRFIVIAAENASGSAIILDVHEAFVRVRTIIDHVTEAMELGDVVPLADVIDVPQDCLERFQVRMDIRDDGNAHA